MNTQGKWNIYIILMMCFVVGMICFFSTLRQNSQIRINTNHDVADSSEKATTSKDIGIKTVSSYPYYGMTETDLNHCLLGKPMIVSECSNFDKLPPERRIKYYYFGYGSGENSGKIIVRYGSQDDENHGYVDSGYYIDQYGVEYQLDPDGVVKVEEEQEAAIVETRKKSGGRLLSGIKDSGTGSSYGKTSAKKSTSATTEFDPDDHDIEGYYEDNKDDFDSIDDAYDAFEDDEDDWEDY